ncbi:MAG: protein translocase subunit SecD [Gammaproteobacteria bacterium]
MNHYPVWKNLLVVLVVVFGFIFAMPNLFGQSSAVQITQIGSTQFPPGALKKAEAALTAAHVSYTSAEADPDKGIIVFSGSEAQLRARPVITKALGDNFSVALNLVPNTPEWMQSIGLKPMAKGLDLVGGIYFRLQVDLDAAVSQMLNNQLRSMQTSLRKADVRYSNATRDNNTLKFSFRDGATADQAKAIIGKNNPDVTFTSYTVQGTTVLNVTPSPASIRQVKNLAVTENVSALRRRVNQLGVAEPIVQQQGGNSIIVELPGMRNAARAKERLGDTATVQFRLVYQGTTTAAEAQRTGRVPLDAQLFSNDTSQGGGGPILLKREIVASGPEITDATSGFDQQSASPDVNVSLNSAGASRMGDVTRHNLGKPMAVLYIQNRTVSKQVDGKAVQTTKQIKKVINVATIQGVFSNRFQITGLTRQEAKSLALTLRTPLAAPVTIVQQQTIGPSLGKQNIRNGLAAVVLGFILVVVGMAVYYKLFGLIADVAIIMNLILIVALLSLLQATLTLPGIAGIVLTVGMAVDANVLINERIREELRVGSSPQAAIQAGYEHAMTAIVDANITTLIAGLVLFTVGSGPIKGFAVTLSLGIVTSMFTAIMGTRAIVNGVFGGRRLRRLPV